MKDYLYPFIIILFYIPISPPLLPVASLSQLFHPLLLHFLEKEDCPGYHTPPLACQVTTGLGKSSLTKARQAAQLE